MDFPNTPRPFFLHTYTQWSAGADVRVLANGTCASITWVANKVMYVPIYVPWPYPVNRVFWVNGSVASSNSNFGIFTRNGRRIYSTGSTVQSGASVPQFVTPGTPFVLAPGNYYFAFASNGTTNRAAGSVAWSAELLKMAGVLEQASNFAMADPATFAAPSSAIYPYCGVTKTQSGF